MNQTNSSILPIIDPQPDGWIYNYPVLKWIFENELGNQLPFPYQVFRTYAYWYFKLFGNNYLHGGRELFQFLSMRLASPDFKFNLSDYTVFLNLQDARFFQVVNELTDRDSDLQVLTDLLAPGDTFIDVGANHGSYSIIACQITGEQGRVIAIEAQPHLARLVEKSLAENAKGQFQVIPVAVGDYEGEVEFLIPDGTSGSAGIFAEHSGTDRFKQIKVPIKRFDQLVIGQNFPGKTLIKLDVEGSESAFLLGAANTIRAIKPDLIIEIHPHTMKAANTTGDDLKQLLGELGFKSVAEISDHNAKLPLADLNTQTQRNVIIYQD